MIMLVLRVWVFVWCGLPSSLCLLANIYYSISFCMFFSWCLCFTFVVSLNRNCRRAAESIQRWFEFKTMQQSNTVHHVERKQNWKKNGHFSVHSQATTVEKEAQKKLRCSAREEKSDFVVEVAYLAKSVQRHNKSHKKNMKNVV